MFLVLDIGGTNIRVGVVDGDSLLNTIIVPTPQNYAEALRVMLESAQTLLAGKPIEAVAAGVRALNRRTGTMRLHGHVHLWENESIQQGLESIFKAPVYLENDSALAALGEAVYGAGRGKKIVGYLTLSTGLGGARVTGGVLDAAADGFEPGHQVIMNVDGTATMLHQRIDGVSLAARYGMPAKDITDVAAWESVADDFAVGVVNTIVHWSPDVVVIGGGIGLSEKLPLERLRERVASLLTVFPAPEITRAALGDDAGLYGAMAHLRAVGALG